MQYQLMHLGNQARKLAQLMDDVAGRAKSITFALWPRKQATWQVPHIFWVALFADNWCGHTSRIKNGQENIY